MFRVVTLERERLLPLANPVWSDVEAALEELGLEGQGFFILTGSDDSYVQIAGSRQRLTVEYRQTLGSRFRHFVLGRSPEDERVSVIRTSVGPISVQRSEVLNEEHARDIGRNFFEDGVVPEAFMLREVTHIFAASGARSS